MKNKWLATCRQYVSVLRERNDCKFCETMLSVYPSLQWARAVSLWRDVSAGVEQKALCLTKGGVGTDSCCVTSALQSSKECTWKISKQINRWTFVMIQVWHGNVIWQINFLTNFTMRFHYVKTLLYKKYEATCMPAPHPLLAKVLLWYQSSFSHSAGKQTNVRDDSS